MEEWESEAAQELLENNMRLAQEVNAFGNEVWDRGRQRMKVSERMKGEEKRGKRKCHSVGDW